MYKKKIIIIIICNKNTQFSINNERIQNGFTSLALPISHKHKIWYLVLNFCTK